MTRVPRRYGWERRLAGSHFVRNPYTDVHESDIYRQLAGAGRRNGIVYGGGHETYGQDLAGGNFLHSLEPTVQPLQPQTGVTRCNVPSRNRHVYV
jgi:hypothetical protein